MLLELAIGDAYGAGFEYAPDDLITTQNTGEFYARHPRHRGKRPGMYTDDAQMSIAMAEAIVSGKPWTPSLLAHHFVTAYRRDPRVGYALRFGEFLQTVSSGEQFLREIIPTSDKSGAAMRAAPVGIFPTISEVIEKSTVQARLTHDTPDGIAAACAASLMTHYFLYELGTKSELGAFLETHVPGRRWAEAWRGKVGAKGWMSVQAAVTAVMATEHMSDLLRACIAFTGDVDTVATIALAAGSCSQEVKQDLPASLISGLENHGYGRDYLVNLDEQLREFREKLSDNL